MPDLPADGQHIWGWFLILSSGRTSSGFGPNPITFLDIMAWAILTETPIRPQEVSAIMALDRAWLSHEAGRRPAGSPGQGSGSAPAKPK